MRKSKKKSYPYLKAFLISFVSVVAILTVVVFAYVGNIQPPEIPPLPEADIDIEDEEYDWRDTHILTAPEGFTSDDRKTLFYTFLIIGLNEGRNTNTIIAASYDGAAKEVNLISIPRDSLVNVSRELKKLSGAYLTGARRGIDGGVAQVQREVRGIIGFVPDFYILVNYNAFYQLIDAVGGIEVEVPFHMKYDDPFQNLHIDIPPGLQQMDGKTALHFARYRNSNRGYRAITDYQRIENQQLVINKTIEKLRRPANILRLPEFATIFTENLHTNLTFGNALWFANQLSEIRGSGAISSHTMPVRGTSGAPSWYEVLNGPAIVDLVNNTINPFNRNIRLGDLDIMSYTPAPATDVLAEMLEDIDDVPNGEMLAETLEDY